MVVDAINLTGLDRSRLDHVVQDVRVEAQTLSPRKFTFMKSDGNHAAHVLSKFAVQLAPAQTWYNEIPNCIRETIFLEKTALGL